MSEPALRESKENKQGLQHEQGLEVTVASRVRRACSSVKLARSQIPGAFLLARFFEIPVGSLPCKLPVSEHLSSLTGTKLGVAQHAKKK